MKYQILHGDNRDTLKTIPDNSIDAIVTDPPYGIDFLGKDWDANTGALETYQECLRVLKPGGHIVAFSAARTYHHLAITLEQAGFEIRDQIMWIYSSGFPKSQDIGRSIQRSLGVKQKKTLTPWENSKSRLSFDNAGEKLADTPSSEQVVCTDPEAQQWEGWGTALKPAHEPIALARKPIKLSIAKNCLTHGVGALNIDATRIPYDDPAEAEADAKWRAKWSKHNVAGPVFQDQDIAEVRKKQNKPSGGKGTSATHKNFSAENTDKEKTEFEPWEASQIGRFPSNVIGDIPDYQKYFYCPKVSRAERHIGHETPPPMFGNVQGAYGPDGNRMAVGLDARNDLNKGNNHPTVKPIELMKYLIRLITPPGGTVLDPFNGSGSTGCAAVELGMTYIGCELDKNYVEIARRRIEAWYEHVNPTTYNQLFEQDTK
jgi:DNA modification methylase